MRIVETTVASEADALRLAEKLVKSRLAACVSILPQLAVYVWEKRLENNSEHLLRIKTTATRCDDVVRWLATEHPYEVPEIIAYDAEVRSVTYRKWLVTNTTAQKK